jgi:hypothetical protein
MSVEQLTTAAASLVNVTDPLAVIRRPGMGERQTIVT